ncbi:MAG: serine/threonine protein kinase [Akkermansiaceae bacterium]
MNISSVPPYSRVVCPQCKKENRVKKQFGPYVVTRRHAIGGMSSVFIANDQTLDREVALKILSEEYSKDEKRIEAFEQEARLTASFSHPNVVRVLTTGRAFGFFYIAMEFVPGGHFEHKIREQGKIPESEILPMAIQIAEGLKGAQSAGLIHRDIKPGNILFDAEGNAKIVDFGLALVTKGGKATASEIWATPYYVPPEAIEGGAEDFRSDIYAFGATLYHALAGIPPCNEESMNTKLLRAAKRKVVPLRRVAPYLTDETCAVIDRAMAYESIQRFGSYDDMIKGFQAAVKACKRQKVGTTRGARTARLRIQKRARNKRIGLLVSGALGLILIGVLSVAVANRKSREPSPSNKAKVVVAGGNTSNDEGALVKIANRYLMARRAMQNQDYTKAEEVFSSLLANKTAQEPTRTWAGLEAVVASFLDGKSGQAKSNAREIFRHISDSPKGLPAGFTMGLQPVLRRINEFPFYRLDDFEEVENVGNEIYMGYLIAGLKNWDQGGLREAKPFFEEIVQKTELGDDNVLGFYQDVAKVYLKDYELLRGGVLDAEPTTPKECREAVDELNRTLTLIETKGRAKFNIRSRQIDFKRLEKALKKELAEKEEPNADLNLFSGQMSALSNDYRFERFSKFLGNLDEDPEGYGRISLIALSSEAAVFLSDLNADLVKDSLEIKLALKDGTQIDAISVGDEEQLEGQFQAGEKRSLKWNDFDSDQLMGLYLKIIGRTEGGEARMRRHRTAVAFEWLVGNRERAVSAAERLSSEDSDFERWWKSVSSGLPE